MNKKLLAVLIGSSLVAGTAIAHADGPTVYGRMRLSLENVDDGTTSQGNKQWDVKNHSSRLGVKGDEDLGGGLKAVYHYEMAIGADTASFDTQGRLSYGGLKGGFGSATIGHQWSAYYNAVGEKFDMLEGTSTLTLTPFRLSNMLKYAGSFGPVNMQVDVIANDGAYDDATDTGDKNKAADRYTVGVSGKAGPVTIAGAYDKITKKSAAPAAKDTDRTGVVVVGNVGPVAITGGGEVLKDTTDAKTKHYLVDVSSRMGDVSGRLGVSQKKDSDGVSGAATKATRPFLNVSYFLSKQTKLFAEYATTNYNNEVEDTKELKFGFRKDF